MREYAVMNDQGVLFGLPARTFGTQEAVESAFDVLVARREEMQAEAVAARNVLEADGISFEKIKEDDLLPSQRDAYGAIRRWEMEKERSYRKVMREVGPWNPLG